MDLSENTDSKLQWSIISSKGVLQSITLPVVVRTFNDFIKVDIYTGDSDPVYWAVARAREGYGHGWATRFSVAMLAYYHTGIACQAADLEGIHFWEHLFEIYPTAPRGTERRHFRGEGGLKTLESMHKIAPNPDRFFDHFSRTYEGVKKYCESNLYAFGPYFQLKVCDYMDRCLGLPILDMRGLASNLPSEPAKAVKLMYPELVVSFSFINLCKQIRDLNLLAAPDFTRLVGPAEVETSLCDWKRMKYGRNQFGVDILDKREALRNYGQRAVQMADWMPPLLKKDTFKVELE